MTKHTNKNRETNRLCVTFEHPEILHEFNNYFYDKYDTVRGYRLQVLEDLIANFNETQKIKEDTPQIIKDNEHLTHEKQRLEDQLHTATTTNREHEEIIKELTKEIEDLKQQVQKYEAVHKDNIRLEETNKKHLSTIDHLTENNKSLNQQLTKMDNELTQARTDYKTLIADHKETIKDLTSKHENTLKQLTTDDNKIIQDLQDKITSKENRYNHLEERNNKLQDDYNDLQDTINKMSYAFGSLTSMSLLDRILKNYPEEIKELKP